MCPSHGAWHMRVHFVVHELFEAPGACEVWARARGHGVTHSRLHYGERLPSTVEGIDMLIVMGGPQSPSTTPAECPHFDAAAEKHLIRQAIAVGKAVLGVCLGAQMIGAALGADAVPSPEKEIGKFPVTLTREGLADPMTAPFGPVLEVGHWHNDMPGLTPDAVVLAASAGCPRQIIRYGERVYGFQCHMEFTPEVVEGLIAAEPGLAGLTGHRFVQQAGALRANDYGAMNEKLFGFLDRLAAAAQGPTDRG